MIRFRQSRLAACVAVLLLFTMYIAPAVSSAASEKTTVESKTVLVMPFQTPEESVMPTLGADMSQGIASAIGTGGSFRAVELSERMPAVKRAIQVDKSLRKEDLQGPFGTEKDQIENALRIARQIAADYVLVGSVDDIKTETDQKAEIAVSAMMLDVKTGETVKTLVVTGVGTDNVTADNAAKAVGQAGSDAVAKVVAGMAIPVSPTPVAGATTTVIKKKSSGSKNKWIFGLLIGVAAGLIASNGSDSSGSSIDVPPPPP